MSSEQEGAYVFDVVLEGMNDYSDAKYRYWSNTDPEAIYQVLSYNSYWERLEEYELNVSPSERDWFFGLQDRNPWFSTEAAKSLILSKDGLYVETDYIEFTFQVAKAFLPELMWHKETYEPIPVLNFHASQRLTYAP